MLVLSRYVGQEIVIGDNVIMKIAKIEGTKVYIAFDAPREIPIYRREVLLDPDGPKGKKEQE